jgi:Ser/Thr protein kinase RdoA (MazF antagonist)
MQEGSVLRLIDFDDAGESWIMFDVVTAVWDLKLLGSAYFEPCYQGFVEGFRQLRGLPDDHLEMFETFFLARVLSYLGHTVSRSHLGNDALQPIFLRALESQGGEYLER